MAMPPASSPARHRFPRLPPRPAPLATIPSRRRRVPWLRLTTASLLLPALSPSPRRHLPSPGRTHPASFTGQRSPILSSMPPRLFPEHLPTPPHREAFRRPVPIHFRLLLRPRIRSTTPRLRRLSRSLSLRQLRSFPGPTLPPSLMARLF